MPFTLVNPPTLYNPVKWGYSHLATVTGELVVISGQFGSDDDGEVVAPDFAAQVERAFENLGKALESVGLGYGDVVRLGTLIVDHDRSKLEVLVPVLERIWGDLPPPQTLMGLASLALPEMLFEVEALAVRP